MEANTGILPVDDRINRIQDLSSDRIIIQESGYLKVYVNNEAQTPVYDDNLVVMQSTGNVIEVNAYYPYGKIIQGSSDVENTGSHELGHTGGLTHPAATNLEVDLNGVYMGPNNLMHPGQGDNITIDQLKYIKGVMDNGYHPTPYDKPREGMMPVFKIPSLNKK